MQRIALVAALAAIVVVAAVIVFAAAYARRGDSTAPSPAPRITEGRSRPNILLVSLDTLRPDHLGCYGYTARPTSPNLDRFARDAFVFQHAYAQAPWTLPSHMSLFTSLLPSHNAVDHLAAILPDEVPTLALYLQNAGYHTAGIVNDGQMKAHWGFAKGYDTWREFPVDQPEGNCENITAEALAWLDQRPAEPFFLFLHYYDAHDPYESPQTYRDAFGVQMSGAESVEVLRTYHFPDKNIENPALLEDLKAAYDSGIAWMDHELGKLLDRVPDNTWVIIFSDHGEAFEEHGWTWHGPTLYEEEIRSVLIIRPPWGIANAGAPSLAEPVMLLDVAPTILSAAGIALPPHFQGADLTPLMAGARLPPRLILSETKAFQEGRLSKSLIHYPWKLIYTVPDGALELYQLPDEHTNVVETQGEVLAAMLPALHDFLAVEDFWVLYARGDHEFRAQLVMPAGQFALGIPLHFDHETDFYAISADMQSIRWASRPGPPPEGVKALYFQAVPPHAAIDLNLRVDGEHRPEMVLAGPRRRPARALPLSVRVGSDPLLAPSGQPGSILLADDEVEFPSLGGFPELAEDGFHIRRYRGGGVATWPAGVKSLDAAR